MKDGLKITMINQGTVIDHLPPGSALDITNLMNLDTNEPVIIAMNVESTKQGRKDMIKVEKKLLSKGETDRISLLAPGATINIIENGSVSGKRHVKPPGELKGTALCPNEKCVTNTEDCPTRFLMRNGKYKCYFCERSYAVEEVRLC